MRGKTVSPGQGAQASQGQVRQVSQLFGEAIGDTAEWVEIHRTSDEWEAKLIQATLSAQQIRCRPIDLKQERQTALLVAPEHEETAMELISRIDAIVTDSEMTAQSEETAEAFKQRDMTVVQEDTSQQADPGDSTELVLAEREGIGSVVYVDGQGYELRVGPEPYVTVPENDWEEFTDFSAQRQEFVILLRHEYPELFEWIQEGKLLAEFIRLIEMTYQEGAPPLPHRSRGATDAEELDAIPYHPLAQLSLTVAVISLIAVLFQIPWQVNLVLAVIAVASAVAAKHQIDVSDGKSTGVPMALSAIVLAGLVVVFAWWLSQRPEPVEPANPSARESIDDR
jgi:predicted nucleic acid-binding protein